MTNSTRKPITQRSLSFLLYDSRSGSTFLSSRLDAFEDIAVTVESNFMRLLLTQEKALRTATHSDAILSLLIGKERFAHLGITEAELKNRLPETGPYDVASIAQTIAEIYVDKVKPTAKAILIKDGINGYWVSQIAHRLPQATFIHILRDGRAVFNSKRQTERPYAPGTMMARDPLTAARHWKSFVNHVEAFAQLHPQKVHTIRFEKMITDSTYSIKKLRRFLGLVQSKFKKTTYEERLPYKEKAIHTKILGKADQERAQAWMTETPEAELYVFDFFCRKTLKNLSYTPLSDGSVLPLLRPDRLAIILHSCALRLIDWVKTATNVHQLQRIIELKILHRKG